MEVHELILVNWTGTLFSKSVHKLRVSHMFQYMLSLSLHSKTSSELLVLQQHN